MFSTRIGRQGQPVISDALAFVCLRCSWDFSLYATSATFPASTSSLAHFPASRPRRGEGNRGSQLKPSWATRSPPCVKGGGYFYFTFSKEILQPIHRYVGHTKGEPPLGQLVCLLCPVLSFAARGCFASRLGGQAQGPRFSIPSLHPFHRRKCKNHRVRMAGIFPNASFPP